MGHSCPMSQHQRPVPACLKAKLCLCPHGSRREALMPTPSTACIQVGHVIHVLLRDDSHLYSAHCGMCPSYAIHQAKCFSGSSGHRGLARAPSLAHHNMVWAAWVAAGRHVDTHSRGIVLCLKLFVRLTTS